MASESDKAIKRLADGDYSGVVSAIAASLRYDALTNQLVIDLGHPLEIDPDDHNLSEGPLTYSIWKIALEELADCLPPFDDPDDLNFLGDMSELDEDYTEDVLDLPRIGADLDYE